MINFDDVIKEETPLSFIQNINNWKLWIRKNIHFLI